MSERCNVGRPVPDRRGAEWRGDRRLSQWLSWAGPRRADGGRGWTLSQP